MTNNLTRLVHRANDAINTELSQLTSADPQLKQAIQYSFATGGKRIRPLLVYCVGQSLDYPLEKLDKLAVAIEYIHTYSLVHDDLPAMDNDNLRRGHPTCHIQFNEATAILVGDALQAEAFNLLCQQDLPPAIIVNMITKLAQAMGPAGMVGGQALDLQAHPDILLTHQLKTGALIIAAVELAAIAGHTQPNSLTAFAHNLGLAFQLQDDLFDQDSVSAHKPAHYFDQAASALHNLTNPAPLRQLLDYLRTRTY